MHSAHYVISVAWAIDAVMTSRLLDMTVSRSGRKMDQFTVKLAIIGHL